MTEGRDRYGTLDYASVLMQIVGVLGGVAGAVAAVVLLVDRSYGNVRLLSAVVSLFGAGIWVLMWFVGATLVDAFHDMAVYVGVIVEQLNDQSPVR